MTAISATSASGTSSVANPFLGDLVASLRTVQLPGSPATYANRATLREMGLRWDPAGHRWHGTTTRAAVRALREQLHLEVRVFGVLEGSPKGLTAPRPVPPDPAPLPTKVPSSPGGPPRDGSCTHLEPRIALPTLGEEADEFVTASRTFTLWETTSGLPDDSRAEDERQETRRLRDLRGRVKAARAAISSRPGAEEILRRDWVRAARFFAQYGITERLFRNGVPRPESPVEVCE